MFELLKKVLKPYGPSGNETEVAEVIQRELTGHVDSMTVDAMGNLIVVKKRHEPQRQDASCSAPTWITSALLWSGCGEAGRPARDASVGGVSAGPSASTRHVGVWQRRAGRSGAASP